MPAEFLFVPINETIGLLSDISTLFADEDITEPLRLHVFKLLPSKEHVTSDQESAGIDAKKLSESTVAPSPVIKVIPEEVTRISYLLQLWVLEVLFESLNTVPEKPVFGFIQKLMVYVLKFNPIVLLNET